MISVQLASVKDCTLELGIMIKQNFVCCQHSDHDLGQERRLTAWSEIWSVVTAWYMPHSEGFDFIMGREWGRHARNITGFGQSEN